MRCACDKVRALFVKMNTGASAETVSRVRCEYCKGNTEQTIRRNNRGASARNKHCSRAGMVRNTADAVSRAAGKATGTRSELPDTFTDESGRVYTLIPAENRGKGADKFTHESADGFKLDLTGLKFARLVVYLPHVLPNYPSAEAYRRGIVPAGFRQPGAPTIVKHWRNFRQFCHANGIEYSAPDGSTLFPNTIPTDGIIVTGAPDILGEWFHGSNRPDFIGKCETALDNRIPAVAMGSGAETLTHKRARNRAITSYIHEREELRIVTQKPATPPDTKRVKLSEAIERVTGFKLGADCVDDNGTRVSFHGIILNALMREVNREQLSETDKNIIQYFRAAMSAHRETGEIYPITRYVDESEKRAEREAKREREATIRAADVAATQTGRNFAIVAEQQDRRIQDIKDKIRFVGGAMFPQSIIGIKSAFPDYNILAEYEMRERLREWTEEIELAFRQTYNR